MSNRPKSRVKQKLTVTHNHKFTKADLDAAERMIEDWDTNSAQLTRAILFGYAEPKGKTDANIQFTLALNLANMTSDLANMSTMFLGRRLANGFRWAMRPETQPEAAILYGATVAGLTFRKLEGAEREVLLMSEDYQRFKQLLALIGGEFNKMPWP